MLSWKQSTQSRRYFQVGKRPKCKTTIYTQRQTTTKQQRKKKQKQKQKQKNKQTKPKQYAKQHELALSADLIRIGWYIAKLEDGHQ